MLAVPRFIAAQFGGEQVCGMGNRNAEMAIRTMPARTGFKSICAVIVRRFRSLLPLRNQLAFWTTTKNEAAIEEFAWGNGRGDRWLRAATRQSGRSDNEIRDLPHIDLRFRSD